MTNIKTTALRTHLALGGRLTGVTRPARGHASSFFFLESFFAGEARARSRMVFVAAVEGGDRDQGDEDDEKQDHDGMDLTDVKYD